MNIRIVPVLVIVLLAAGNVFPASILAQSSDWRTYRNEKHGFEIKYPGDWKLQEYKMRGGKAVVYVAVDPKKTVSQEASETIDAPRGLIEISFCEVDCNSINAVLAAQLDVKIGHGNSVNAKKQERITGEREPNPWYSNKRIIAYYTGPVERFGDYIICDVIITYISDLDDKYLKDFNQILSTVKYTDKFKFTDKNLPKNLPRPFASETQVNTCARKGEMCGGIAGISCCPGLTCKYDGTYPDASGVCITFPETREEISLKFNPPLTNEQRLIVPNTVYVEISYKAVTVELYTGPTGTGVAGLENLIGINSSPTILETAGLYRHVFHIQSCAQVSSRFIARVYGDDGKVNDQLSEPLYCR